MTDGRGFADRIAGLSPRRSFAGKLLVALVGTVGLLLLVVLAAVRAETAGQVELTIRRAVESADDTFRQLERVQRSLMAEITARLTRGRRTVALLEAAIESGDPATLEEDIAYEVELTGIEPERLLLVFTDPDGAPVLAQLGGRDLGGDDPAGVRSLVERMWDEGLPEVRGYRVVEGRLFMVQSTFLELGRRPVGTLTLGLPITDEMALTLASVGGTEICFVVEGRCIVGTPAPGDTMRGELVRATREEGTRRLEVGDSRWAVLAGEVDPRHPGEAARALAVPLDPVLAPFDRISRTLAVGGVLALLVSLLLGSVLARGLATPVKKLVAATRRIAEGDLETRVRIESRDELGTLGTAFNEMAHGLALKERYRGVLDKVVSREVAEELLQGELELGGENREVTVLFADIRGFTSLTEGMEPQGVIGLLNECMAVLSAAVDAEGGVVDKYVGDELMALFGAPVPHPDAAARAVRAAGRMCEGIEALNRERQGRGEGRLGLGIGISTGTVVAGNMGSPDRLNYTVLGEAVNLGARLCSAAGARQVLVSGATAASCPDSIDLRPAGTRALKGFSSDVEVYALAMQTEDATPKRPGAAGAAGSLLLATLLPLLAAPGGLAAQDEGGLPTLGVGWISESGRYQVDLSGRLDAELYAPDDSPAWLIPDTEPFFAPRLRLFVDVFAGDRVYGLLELRADRGEEPTAGDVEARLEQAFVRWSTAGGGFAAQVGRFTTPFGGYPQRHHTEADPLIRPPLPYEYRTVLSERMAPTGVVDLLMWRDDPDRFRPDGRPVVWGVPYQWGAMIMGTVGHLDGQLAWMNSAPSSGPGAWKLDFDRFGEGSLVASLGFRVTPELRLTAWYDQGPWMEEVLVRELQPGAGPGVDPTFGRNGEPGEELPRSAYDQRIAGFGASFARGGWALRGEAFVDTWEVPNVPDDPRDVSWFVEAETDLTAGLFAAARYGEIVFGELDDPRNGEQAWDHDVSRLQVGLGYRVFRNFGVRGEYMTNRTGGPVDPDDDLISLQAWWEF